MESGGSCSRSGPKLYVFFNWKTLFRSRVLSLRSSVERAGLEVVHMMNTN
jgi:hypothetical protein